MSDECPHCPLTYDKLRTGETYQSIYLMFWSGNEDSSTWVNKRRHTILGRWRQIKLSMWDQHLDNCHRQHQYELEQATANIHGTAIDAELDTVYQTTAQHAHFDDHVPF